MGGCASQALVPTFDAATESVERLSFLEHMELGSVRRGRRRADAIRGFPRQRRGSLAVIRLPRHRSIFPRLYILVNEQRLVLRFSAVYPRRRDGDLHTASGLLWQKRTRSLLCITFTEQHPVVWFCDGRGGYR